MQEEGGLEPTARGCHLCQAELSCFLAQFFHIEQKSWQELLVRLTYLTPGLPPTSEPETFKPYCQYGAEGERVGSFRWECLVQSEEKAASPRRGEQEMR